MNLVDRIGSAFLRTILIRMKELGVNKTELAKRMNVSRPYGRHAGAQGVWCAADGFEGGGFS